MKEKHLFWFMATFILLGYAGMGAAALLQGAGHAAVLYNTIGLIGVGCLAIGVIVLPLIFFWAYPAYQNWQRDRLRSDNKL